MRIRTFLSLAAGMICGLATATVHATSWPASVPLNERVLPRAGVVVDHRAGPPAKRADVSFYRQAADGSIHVWDPASWAAAHPQPKKRRVTKVTGEGPTFEIEYKDVTNDTNDGFDDPSLGQMRRDTAEAMFLQLSDLLAPHTGGTAEITFEESETDGEGALGTGGPTFLCIDGFRFGFTRDHIVTGADPDDRTGQDLADANITIDFGHPFNNGLDDPTQSEFDLASTILHEATHALGFVSGGVNADDGSVRVCGQEPNTTSTALEYVRHLHRISDGQQLWQETGASGGVVFQGEAADVMTTDENDDPDLVDYRGEPPNTPLDIFEGDLSHWSDEVIVGEARPVMLTAQFNGERRRQYQSWEKQILIDLGYSLTGGGTVALNAPGSLAGAWLDFARNGEGFLIDVFELSDGSLILFVAWFTYDDAGNQQWMIAQQGGLEELVFGEPIEMDILRVTGPSFSDFDPADQVEETWGTMTLTFENCTNATVDFDSVVGFDSGSIEIDRFTSEGLAGVSCQ